MADKPQPIMTDPDELRRIGVLPATFAAAYTAGKANWEIGAPQPWLVELADRGAFRGRVLDVGCGSGENALNLARRGIDVTAIDCVEQAVRDGEAKTRQRGLTVVFRTHDALALDSLDGIYDTLLDSAVFHVFSDADRARYVEGLASKLRAGGFLHLLVFADEETRPGGPRRVSREELQAAFVRGWRVHSIERARYLVRMFEDGARCWYARIERIAP